MPLYIFFLLVFSLLKSHIYADHSDFYSASEFIDCKHGPYSYEDLPADDLPDLEPRCNNETPYFISLGRSCMVAHRLQQFGLRAVAYPFDWIIIEEMKMVTLAIENKFESFFDREHLIPLHSPNIVYNIKYNLTFVHDFIQGLPFLEGYQEVFEKYQRRIHRFFEALHSNGPVVFLRLSTTFEEAVEFCELISKEYPQLSYILLCINEERFETQRPNWNHERIVHLWIPDYRVPGKLWTGDDQFWKNTTDWLKAEFCAEKDMIQSPPIPLSP